MTLNKTQIEKLQEIECLYFEKSMEMTTKRGEFLDKYSEHGSYPGSVMEYVEELGTFEGPPFFNMSSCTRMIEHKTVITDDGFCTMTWRVEWDHGMINNGFKEGCEWANQHGAGIPINDML